MKSLDFTIMKEWMPEALEIQALVNTWAVHYGVDQDQIIEKICDSWVWMKSNKKRYRKPTRFINNYLKKAKAFGNLEPKAKAVEKAVESTSEEMSIEDMVAIRRQNFSQYRPDPAKFPEAIDTQEIK